MNLRFVSVPAFLIFVLTCVATLSGAGVGQTTGVALVRKVPAINGGGVVDGGIHMMSAGGVTLNGGATITGDLLVPGTPSVRVNGKPAYGGTVDGTGATTPSNYQITLNGNASLFSASHSGRLAAPSVPLAASPCARWITRPSSSR